MRKSFFGALVAILLTLAGCYTVPETGRSAFVLPLGDEVAEGASAFAGIKANEKLSTDAGYNERARRVGGRIAAAVGKDLPAAKWEFVVFDDDKTVNAFALPGGKVGVYTGLLKLAETDAELAVVMGHEIAHVTARHGSERMSKGVAAAVVGVVLDTATKNSNNHDLMLAAYGAGAGGVMLKFSRDNESEADYIGIRYAAKAGYDPHAALDFWRKMAKEEKGAQLPAFLRTHPTDAQRITDLQKAIPGAQPLYDKARKQYEE